MSGQRVPAVIAAVVLLAFTGCGGRGAQEPPASSGGPAAAPAAASAGELELVFTYGSEKEKWIEEATRSFHDSRPRLGDGRSLRVTALPLGSGECIDELITGRRQAHLTSPASAAFIRLGNAESRAKTGRDLVGATENLVLSPVVIAMWRPMAEALGWGQKPVGWAEVLALAREPRGWAARGHPEWGSFKFGHTHPDYSNSGLISLFAEVYAAAGKTAGLTLEDLARPAIAADLAAIESAVVHYGSSTGFFGRRLFSGGPGYLSAAVLYENMVSESYGASPPPPLPIVALYPKEGTFWSDHPIGTVERDWVTPAHREAAALYIRHLLARPQQERAMAYGFRPADPAVSLTSPIDAAHGVDPAEPRTTLEVPAPEVMRAVVELWRRNKKHAQVALLLDVSGSMREQDKISHAKAGAEEFIGMLGGDDLLSLVVFNQRVQWAARDVRVGTEHESLRRTVQGFFADGGTALYDAIEEAYSHLTAEPAAGRIAALVVLSDGQDRNSRAKLEALLARIRFDPERPSLRVFTIGYGADAEAAVLESLAAATQGKFYKGKPEDIREVFKDISTFF